jgi:hypothetical protein
MPAPIIRRTDKYWFADNYQGAPIDPDKGVLHTTEGTTLPWYDGGAKAPHYTAVPDFTAKRLVWHIHFPDTMSSRALRNESGGVETNTEDCIQVELVGTCDATTSSQWKAAGRGHIYWPDAPQWALDELAEFVAYQFRKNGIRIEGPEQVGEPWRAYPASYGKGAAQRFTFAQWNAFKGWCGHQHVPENSHGDPGGLDWAYVEKKAKQLVTPTSEASLPPVHNPPLNAAGERVMHFGALRYAGEHRYVSNWYLAYVDQALASLAALGMVPQDHPRTEFPEAWQKFEKAIGRAVVNSIPDEYSFGYFVARCGYKPPDGSVRCGGPTFINDWP